MEGVGAEVSKKIRSAITAKLMELGAYVDDELPDYIMVMVANKRSKQQMDDDLELFLTDNTSAFTTWLHQVLSKLQEVTLSLDKKSCSDNDKKKKGGVSDEHKKEKEKKKRSKSEKDKDDDKSQSTCEPVDHDLSHGSTKPELKKDVNSNGLKWTKSQSDSESKTPVMSIAQEATPSISKPVIHTEDEDDDFINLKADADLWEGEVDDISLSSDVKDKESVKAVSRRTSEASKVSSQEPTKSAERLKPTRKDSTDWERSPTPPVPATPAVAAAPAAPAVSAPARPQTISRIIKISQVLREEEETLHSSAKRALDDKRTLKKADGNEVLTTKILAPPSHPTVASRLGRRHVEKVTRRRISDAGLSSRRSARKMTPDTGRSSGRSARDDSGLASVIRVLPRPRRPAALQPSCSLILKAVAEAEKSVATARRPQEIRRSPLKSRQVPVQAASPAPPPGAPTTAPLKIQKPKSKSPLFTRWFREKANLTRTVVNTDVFEDDPMYEKDEETSIRQYVESLDERTENTTPENPGNILVQVSSSDRFTSLQDCVPTCLGCANPKLPDLAISESSNAHTLKEAAKDATLCPEADLKILGVSDRASAAAVPGTAPPGSALPGAALPGAALPGAALPPPTTPQTPQTCRMANVSRWLEGVEHVTDTTGDVDMEVDTDEARSCRQDVEMDDGGSELELSELELGAGLDALDDDDRDDDYDDDAGDETSRRDSASKITPQFVVTLDGVDPLLLRSFGIDAQSDCHSNYLSPSSSNDKRHLVVETPLDEEEQLRAELLSQQAAAAASKAKLRTTSTGGSVNQLASSSSASKMESVSRRSGSPVTVRRVEELPQPERVPQTERVREKHIRGVLKRSASPITFDEPSSKKGKGGAIVTDSLTALSKTKTPERCKFWPTCRQGDLCEFHHPTVQCRMFPNCKFGELCLYIHPNCRFDSACTRRDCPYTHSSHRTAPTPPVPTKNPSQLCKFFPRCTNTSCPFLHPKMCRFGAYCTKQNCLFAHDDKSTSTKMKWVSSQQ